MCGQSKILGDQWEFLYDGSRIEECLVPLFVRSITKVSYIGSQLASYHVCSFVLSSNSALIQYPFLHAGSYHKLVDGKL